MIAATKHSCICPQATHTINKRAGLGSIWRTEEWRLESDAYRARHFPFCSRCMTVARIVPGHSGEDYGPGEIKKYVQKVRDDQIVPLCHRCNRMEAKGRHPCLGCIAKHREDQDHFIRYIGQDQELCFVCEHGGDGTASHHGAKLRHRRHSCAWNKGNQRCSNPLRHDRICPYSSRDAAGRCDPDHFMARKGERT